MQRQHALPSDWESHLYQPSSGLFWAIKEALEPELELLKRQLVHSLRSRNIRSSRHIEQNRRCLNNIDCLWNSSW